MNSFLSSHSGRRKQKCPSVLQIFPLLLQKSPASNILPHSPHPVDSVLSAVARHLPGSPFISFLSSLAYCLLPTSAVFGIAASVSVPGKLPELQGFFGRHTELKLLAYWYVSPHRLKTAYGWRSILFYCILCAWSKS